MMKLGNIKIATLLLIAVFTYDIFFVFITPLFLDGESIMITVAKGGGGETVADDFCYKYPEDKDCTGIDFLPMLLLVPRFNDYQRGSALLGLGDIVCKLCTPVVALHELLEL
jgi:signal peptide peptidase-like protein 2B